MMDAPARSDVNFQAMLMRCGWLLLLPVALYAQDDPPAGKLAKRYGFEVNLFFSQKTPQEALQSVVKALENKRVDYLLAQIADPLYVDTIIDDYKLFFAKGKDQGKSLLAFDRLVREVTSYYQDDPQLLQELRRFVKEAEWEAMEDKASASVKALPGRKVFMRKLENRWFLENRQQ